MKKTDAYASLGADRKRFMSWQIRTILITMAGYALFYFVRKNFSLAMPGLTAEYGISNTNFGWIIFAGSLVYGFSRFINGYVVDRIRGRIVMALGLLLCVDILRSGLPCGIELGDGRVDGCHVAFLCASLSLPRADSMAAFLSAGSLSPYSLSCFSVAKMFESRR